MWFSLAFADDVGPQQVPYLEQVAALEVTRQQTPRVEAREALFDAITELLPRWTGTAWSFYGDAEEPGVEPVACGYFVSVILRDAGLRVERRRLAQQASEHIIQTLVPEAKIRRFRDRPASEVVAHVGARDGVTIVGLDDHVGFLISEGGVVRFCHSDAFDERGPVCEDPLTAAGFVSRYRVTGELLHDGVLDGWLAGKPWPTVTE
jgi:hypothetical protein